MLRLTFRSIMFFFLIGFFQVVYAGNVCELQINICPKNFDGKVVKVPFDVVSISKNISMCRWIDFIEGTTENVKPPTIMFVIDHSYSMMGLGNTYPGNDVQGSRFTVTRDLLDTIYSRHPDAEVGLVVFREVLYFDHRNNSMFEQLSGQGDQSFLPLLQLNSKYKGNQSGMDVIKSVLKTETVTRVNNFNQQSVTCTDLVYTPEFSTIGNTNINNAFSAALQAMKNARNPPERQFVIFLSDGEPFPLNDSTQHGNKDPFYFMQGIGTPTTFTVYLHNIETQPPASIRTLTNNVRINNYSSSNAFSDVWTLKTDYNALMSLFMKSIINPIFVITQGSATTLNVNNDVSTTLDGSHFVLKNPIPLKVDTTSMKMEMRFRVESSIAGKIKDSLFTFGFKIVRENGAVLPDGMEKTCHEQPAISLYYNSQQVKQVTNVMQRLEVQFDPKGYNYTAVQVEIRSNTANSDIEKVTLSDKKNYWSGTFPRVLAGIKKNDGLFQHTTEDSIVVIYRNPLLPLDTVRYAVPFINTDSIPPVTTSFKLVANAINNPMKTDSRIPQPVKSVITSQLGYCPEFGSVIAVVPEGKIENAAIVEGTVTIYDAVKNMIVNKKPMTGDSEKRLFYVWDGRNSHGRNVGSGTYLAVIELFINKKPDSIKKIYLGVQR